MQEPLGVGNVITSHADPSASFTVDPSMRFIGHQTLNLYGNAEGEQFVFAAASRSGVVDRLLWIQLEHFLPTNTMRYDSGSATLTELGDFSFFYDVWAYSDYGVTVEDPKSDGAAMARLLQSHGLSLPTRVARVRLFHFPAADRRREVMIIYAEAVPVSSSIPVTGNRISLDRTAPAAAAELLARARAAVTAHRIEPMQPRM